MTKRRKTMSKATKLSIAKGIKTWKAKARLKRKNNPRLRG